MMKHILNFTIAAVVTMFTMASCTKFDIVDTGSSNGDHDMVMWDYFKADPYNWDSIMVMANHAGVKDIFDGTSKYGKDITFLGITNHSIRRYLLTNDLQKVTDIPADECREIILSNLIAGAMLVDDFIEGKPSEDTNELIGTGGKKYTTFSGKTLWIYTIKEPFGGVPQAGAKSIQIVALDTQKRIRVASTDIKTRTGVVQALDYNFTIKDI